MKIKSILQLMPALVISASIFSCGGPAKTTATDSTTVPPPDSSAKTAKATPAAITAPFDVVEVSTTVKDFDKWRPTYNTDSADRRSSGMQDMVIGRGVDNTNQVLVVEKISDVAKAKAFVADPKLKANMDKGGVNSKPDVEYFHVIRFNSNSKEKQWVIITHKVKDFDAWLKVYDGEGTAKRAAAGLVDVALARGIDDPNLVHIVFDITDMAKAKADMASDAKKKLMMSAGVIGKPIVQYYTTAQ